MDQNWIVADQPHAIEKVLDSNKPAEVAEKGPVESLYAVEE